MAIKIKLLLVTEFEEAVNFGHGNKVHPSSYKQNAVCLFICILDTSVGSAQQQHTNCVSKHKQTYS